MLEPTHEQLLERIKQLESYCKIMEIERDQDRERSADEWINHLGMEVACEKIRNALIGASFVQRGSSNHGSTLEINFAEGSKKNRTQMLVDALKALDDCETSNPPWRPTHRHVKRGSEYEFLGEAEGQIAVPEMHNFNGPSRIVSEGNRLCIYRQKDGKMWWRFPDEFNDGRFARIDKS